jgi:outer membrane protein assembly factor BamB
MSARLDYLRHVLVSVLFAVILLYTCALADEGAEDAIDDSNLRTTADLLRGFNDEELAEARKSVTPRREPPLELSQPRLVTVTGNVYEDLNTNGLRDSDEASLPGVTVTDGEIILQTTANGDYRFCIRMAEEPHYRFVVVTRPTGYKPTNDFFLRIPFNDERTEYSIDFGFHRDTASAKHKFWFMTASDSQFTSIEQMIPIAKDYAQITSAPGGPAFLATAGDLTMTGSQFEWDMYDQIRRSSKIPVYEGFGGHDGNCLEPRCTVSFEQRIGPPYYSWDYGGVHFIQFVTETGYLLSKAQQRQKEWLIADLKSIPPKTPVIAISHYPLDSGWFDQRKAEGINVICQIGAHWHVVYAGSRQGVPVLNSAPARGGDWGAFSRTYRWVYVSPEGVHSKLRVAGQYKRLKAVAPAPSTVLGKQPLVVLAYDTALQVSSVTCSWTSPEGQSSTTALDQQGDWSWHGTFAPKTAGIWHCELHAIDVSGTMWKRTQTINVEPDKMPVAMVGADFPWLLAGEPPRCIAGGPTPPLLPLWIKHTGSVHVLHNSPVIADGRVFVSVGNPNAGTPGAGVLCLDVGTGKEIWRANSPRGDIRGPVSVHEKLVYVISGEGWVAAFESATGKRVWSKPMDPDYQQGRPLAINSTPPIPTRYGLLVSNWQKPQLLLDYMTGEHKIELAGNVGYYSSFATVFDNVMYSVRRGGGSALRLPNGEHLWSIEEKSRSTSAPIVVDGKFIFHGSSGIRVCDASTGNLIWQKGTDNAGRQNPVPVVWDDQILVNGTDLRFLDLETGETRETVPCAREANRFLRSRRQTMAGSSTPIVAGTFAWFGHDDTSIRAVNRDGNVVWEYCLGTPIKTAPAISGNLLLVHDYAGNLWCFAGKGDLENEQ